MWVWGRHLAHRVRAGSPRKFKISATLVSEVQRPPSAGPGPARSSKDDGVKARRSPKRVGGGWGMSVDL